MCEYLNDNNQREIFVDTIREKLIGPGGDILGFPNESEVVSIDPTKLYYSGILFAKNFASANLAHEAENADEQDEQGQHGQANENIPDEDVAGGVEQDDLEASNQRFQSFYPSSCGLVFAVKNETEKIKVKFSYATYKPAKPRKICLNLEEKNKLFEILTLIEINEGFTEKYGANFFTNAITYDIDRGVLELETIPHYTFEKEGQQISAKISDKHLGEIKNRYFKELPMIGKMFYKLLAGYNLHFYERFKSEVPEFDINVSQPIEKEVIILEEKKLLYYVTVKEKGGNKVVKILLRNENFAEAKSCESCYFQVKIRVETNQLVTYHNPINSAIDEDLSVVDFQYQDLHTYGKGVNCAVSWEKEKFIETTYLPEVEINSFSNIENKKIKEKNIGRIFELRNLSIWTTLSVQDILTDLTIFAETYKQWIDVQTNPGNNAIADGLIEKQRTTYSRLINNIEFLRNNSKAFYCFKLANTAMMIQMVVANMAKDPNFVKGREYSEMGDFNYDDLNFFQNYAGLQPKYRPFQLAFLLMNVEPTFNKKSADRNSIVDLIWFPTGGGKTEAYLALTALTIIERRRNNGAINTSGVSVIMRYTLRLLTAQQFERATWLICALEFLRKKMMIDNVSPLGQEKITIGMWVGGTTTPNKYDGLTKYPFNKVFEIFEGNYAIERKHKEANEANKFPISYCPWCGCKLITLQDDNLLFGYLKDERNKRLDISCVNQKCFFKGWDQQTLPVTFIDDQIYKNPPTLLFATVDKMVQLSKNDQAGNLFNEDLPPDLIIQDELHLLSGPLGTLTALYEVLIDQLCTTHDRKPKIVASTATTRNTSSVVKLMYNRALNVFPPQGVRYDDNFFSFVEGINEEGIEKRKRKHIGIMPVGHPAGTTEIKLVATIYEAKVKLLKCFLEDQQVNQENIVELLDLLNGDDFKNKIDPYWTLVLYYNNLRDLGRSKSRVSVDFQNQIEGLFNENDFKDFLRFVYNGMHDRAEEFTSRQESSKIKALLTRTEQPVSFTLGGDRNQYINENSENMDMALASNMFSVGIDVSRLNLMLMIGQPGSVAEYIQSSSRVARASKGLVINLLNPMRARELSIFEDYTAFHEAYYKNVEPLSITPFTEMAVDKLMNAVLVGFVRQKLNVDVKAFALIHSENLKAIFQERIVNEIQLNYIKLKLDELANTWRNTPVNITWNQLTNETFDMMNSLRDIDQDVFIKNNDLNYN